MFRCAKGIRGKNDLTARAIKKEADFVDDFTRPVLVLRSFPLLGKREEVFGIDGTQTILLSHRVIQRFQDPTLPIPTTPVPKL